MALALAGWNQSPSTPFAPRGEHKAPRDARDHYLIGLVVVVMFVLSLLGLR